MHKSPGYDRVPELAAWRKGGRMLDIRGHQIFTREEGSGPPLLLIHGFPTASYDYARIWPLLAAEHRLITLDFLGFGYSDKPRAHRYSLFDQADLIEEVAAHYGVTQTAMIAHDMGSSVALELLRRKRLQIRRLVLLNGSVLLRHYRPLITQRLLLHRAIGPLITRLRLISRTVFARQFARLFPQPVSAAEIDAFWSLITHKDGVRIYHLLIGYLRERKVHELRWLQGLAAHRAPLLVLWGQRDPVSVPAIAEAVIERRPDARYVPLHELGHFPHWEDPQRIAQEVLTFLRETAG